MDATRTDGRAALAFARLTQRIHAVLPGALKAIPVTFIGYAIINGSAFGLDMAFLSVFHGWGAITYPIAVTLGYALASVYAFLLNRWLNFRAHGQFARQSARYTFTIVSNYVIWILGFSTLLEHLGVQYQVARFTAACIEGIYIYVLLRWWVFRKARSNAAVVELDEAAPVVVGEQAA
ncbi:GtrA family protein [Aestuariimicrobium ganziense]|uniref:GtrA family protein n=1 Tax=Aestuariimicrobium ganziense TaxID=2773677 RepID=UPI002E2D2247|nr:GtrA family protein [Aestuariimicrobium ganziense]